MTRCQTDRMHNDGSSRQHGRQQCAWPSMAKRPDHKKGRPLAEWLSSPAGAWSFLAFLASPRPSFLSASLARQRICVVSAGRQRCAPRRRLCEGSDKQLCFDATAAWQQQGAMYQAMHTAVEKNRALNWQSRRSMPCFCTERSVRCKLHLWPARRTGLMGLQPYVSTSLRAFQIAVLLQIAQSQFVSVESHSSVFFLLCVLVAMVSKTCYFLIVFFK